MNILDMILNPRACQRLKEFPCSVCHKQFEYIEGSDKVLNGFVDADMKVLVHKDCKKKHYFLKDSTEHKGLFSEMPLTMDDLEAFAEIGIK